MNFNQKACIFLLKCWSLQGHCQTFEAAPTPQPWVRHRQFSAASIPGNFLGTVFETLKNLSSTLPERCSPAPRQLVSQGWHSRTAQSMWSDKHLAEQ